MGWPFLASARKKRDNPIKAIPFDYILVNSTMEDRQITKYALITKYGLSPSLMTRLKRNQSISVHTVDTLCKIYNGIH